MGPARGNRVGAEAPQQFCAAFEAARRQVRRGGVVAAREHGHHEFAQARAVGPVGMEHGDRLFGRDEAEPTRGVTPPLPREQQQGHDPAEQRAEHGACEQHEQHDELPRGGEDAAHAFTLYRQVDGGATGTDAQPINAVQAVAVAPTSSLRRCPRRPLR